MSAPFTDSIIDQFYRTEQVDLLHVALTNLLEMIAAGDIDVLLDQQSKTAVQKKAFIQKIVNAVESPELKQALQSKLAEGDIEFFRERTFESVLNDIQRTAEKIVLVKLQVAIDFKEKDLRDMARQLEEQLGTRVVIAVTIEHSLIGGAVIQYGTAIRDYSVKSRFDQFRTHWKSATFEDPEDAEKEEKKEKMKKK